MVYFHTKYYMLKTMDDHLKLSFTLIMKHWKKNTMPMPIKAGNNPNSDRTTVLRYYPPPSKSKSVYIKFCVDKVVNLLNVIVLLYYQPPSKS